MQQGEYGTKRQRNESAYDPPPSGVWDTKCLLPYSSFKPTSFAQESEIGGRALEQIILLGDSIFDNSHYTEGEPDVISHLRSRIPQEWKATLCAVDGSVAKDLRGQLGGIPAYATRLVVSAGGNDALAHIRLLEDDAMTGPQLLHELRSR
jgi:hypothetical protein